MHPQETTVVNVYQEINLFELFQGPCTILEKMGWL